MNLIYSALSLALVTSVMQSSLDRRGIGRVEETINSTANNALIMLSIPITLLSNIGLIVITIWTFFVLPWIPSLGVITGAWIGFSLIWGNFLSILRRSESWEYLMKNGIPLVFSLRLICFICVVFLGICYSRGAI
jgi:hypothetical protein